jgi:small-conductance mechanosensitive channel
VASEDLTRQKEVRSDLRSIVDSCDKWLGRIRTRQFQVRLATSFLTAILFLIISAAVVFSAFALSGTNAFQNIRLIAVGGISTLIVFIATGFITYYSLKKRQEARLSDLSNLIARMKKRLEDGSAASPLPTGAQGGTIEDALFLADKTMELLPELVRKRNQDTLLFGFAAFILALIVGRNPGIAVLVGVIVWLYFRYEMGKTYDREIARFEEQKKILQQRKQDFLETL